MHFTPIEEMLDNFYGKEGTPDREEFERKVSESVLAYRIGEAVKKARLEQKLTQTELGERIGVKKGQISRIERGHSVSLPTVCTIFRALGVASASIDLEGLERIALW